ncbi:hypothetical protein EDB89DRAFT_2077789 [Lactarius sanguifluus]|nr:hypothetical protein EDB89DRAFT_2077789 [Lactarius sanguifluus]
MTGDWWGWNQVQSYTIPGRGERNVPTCYLKAARWRTHRGETGYFVDFPNRPSRYYPVEFNFEHTCWCILATNDAGIRTVVRPTTHEYRCNILESEVVPTARIGPIDGAVTTSTTEEDSGSDRSSKESEEDHLLQVNVEEEEELANLASRITLRDAPQAEQITVHPPIEMTTTQLEPTYQIQVDSIQLPQDGVPEDLLPINPSTGHQMTADNAALMRAIGPDEPDPPGGGGGPPGEGPGRGHPHGGGGGGPPGGGGFPGIAPIGNPPRSSDRLLGNPPMIFNGNRTKALQFRAQWNLYQGINSHCHSVQAALSARPHPNTLPRHGSQDPATSPQHHVQDPATTNPPQHDAQDPTANLPPRHLNTVRNAPPPPTPTSPPIHRHAAPTRHSRLHHTLTHRHCRPNTACRTLPPPTRHTAPPQHGLKTPSPPTRHCRPNPARKTPPSPTSPHTTSTQDANPSPLTQQRHRNAARKTPPSPP